MNYEVVNLKQKTVAGLTIRTSNSDPNMTRDIGQTWERFFSAEVFESIPNKGSASTLGLYTNYENGATGAYDMMVCCEINEQENLPAQLDVKTIPAGKYAKFVMYGDAQKAVGEFWTELWKMDLDRKFDCDFEEYQSDGGLQNMEIHIYISLK